MLKSNHVGRWLSCLSSLLWPKKWNSEFSTIFISIYISFPKKYFCGRPHEIYFRHPVRRKQSYFFWPKHGLFSSLWKLTERKNENLTHDIECHSCFSYRSNTVDIDVRLPSLDRQRVRKTNQSKLRSRVVRLVVYQWEGHGIRRVRGGEKEGKFRVGEHPDSSKMFRDVTRFSEGCFWYFPW